VKGDGGGNIAVVVNDRGFNTSNPIRVTTYACFPASSATANVVLPLYKEFTGGNTTGIQVQNVGAGPATVQVTYQPTGGAAVTVSNSTPIAVGASTTFFGVSSSQPSLNNTFGGVVITSNQPIVAIANEASNAPNPSGQDTKNYEGFNQ
jgi:hypothetical protein